jgi:hypothetical protein
MCDALQRQNTEISKQIFPEKEYRGLSPNFHIQASANSGHRYEYGNNVLPSFKASSVFTFLTI